MSHDPDQMPEQLRHALLFSVQHLLGSDSLFLTGLIGVGGVAPVIEVFCSTSKK